MDGERESFAYSNCRLCLQDGDMLFDIFEEHENDGFTPADIISRLLDPQVSKDDGYPQVCCMECIRKLRAYQSIKSLDLSPSFMLFMEKTSMAKAVLDCTYYHYNEIQQHSPISEDHSPLCLDLESYASLEEQRWHYNDILKAVAQILEEMNTGEGGSNTKQSSLEENLHATEISAPQKSLQKSECIIKTEIFEEPITFSAKKKKQKSNNRWKKAGKSPGQSQQQSPNNPTVQGHTKNRFQCSTCGIRCAGRQDLEKHLVVHTNERPFPCPLCPKAFRHKRNLQVHLKIHSGIKDLVCAHCGKAFSNRSLLRSHLITHDPSKKFSCEECGKQFKRMALLKLHTKVHTNVRPHKCKICGLRFIQRSDLTKHIPVHSGLRAFSCSICKKTFAHKRNMREHERIHREDVFECSYCGKQWKQKVNLRKHLAKGCSLQKIKVKVEIDF